ncbi:MAG: SPOR domain-containing protein [Bacteroidaceae bacterium]|nr:SPOR domain-containing protein [Bacteroidaceae bacterium]
MKKAILILSVLFCALYAGAQSNTLYNKMSQESASSVSQDTLSATESVANIVNELQRVVPGSGIVYVNQPANLNSLMGSMMQRDGKPAQVEGYRILLYSGNNSRAARDEANAMAEYMRKYYPEAQVYVVFESPIRSCQYGDFRTREEAEAVMYRLKATRRFKEISVTKGMINLPY